MSKEEVLKLAKAGGATENEMSSDGAWNICMTEYTLLAFANACEKIGMEKAIRIADNEKVDYAFTRDLGDLAYNTAIEHVITAIRAHKK